MRVFVRPESFIFDAGGPGERFTAAAVARHLGVHRSTVMRWIKRGWLRATETTRAGYRIRRRSVRRLLLDYPSAARYVADARVKAIRRKGGEIP